MAAPLLSVDDLTVRLEGDERGAGDPRDRGGATAAEAGADARVGVNADAAALAEVDLAAQLQAHHQSA